MLLRKQPGRTDLRGASQKFLYHLSSEHGSHPIQFLQESVSADPSEQVSLSEQELLSGAESLSVPVSQSVTATE